MQLTSGDGHISAIFGANVSFSPLIAIHLRRKKEAAK
jgi:hypothetical protein